jgi:hypothetical protein
MGVLISDKIWGDKYKLINYKQIAKGNSSYTEAYFKLKPSRWLRTFVWMNLLSNLLFIVTFLSMFANKDRADYNWIMLGLAFTCLLAIPVVGFSIRYYLHTTKGDKLRPTIILFFITYLILILLAIAVSNYEPPYVLL